MSHYTYYGTRAMLRTLTGLDFGLRVHVNFQFPQLPMFSGAENLSARRLISELAQQISSLRVYSYALRGQLEDTTSALQVNAACGSWRYARRAAQDLEDLLLEARRRRLADSDWKRTGKTVPSWSLKTVPALRDAPALRGLP